MINNFIEIWCLVASGGLHFCVSSTSFQKIDIGWPQQPPTETVLISVKNWIFDDSFLKKLPDSDGLILSGTKMTNTGPFLWNESSKIQFFTDIWYLLCRRLLRPAYVTRSIKLIFINNKELIPKNNHFFLIHHYSLGTPYFGLIFVIRNIWC